jgi:hypothetical protein
MMTRDKYVLAVSLLAVAVLAISPIAHADPVHMKCSGQRLLPNGRVDMDSILSLTIDLGAETVTVGGYEPLTIMPEIPASPAAPNTKNNEVSFIGETTQAMFRWAAWIGSQARWESSFTLRHPRRRPSPESASQPRSYSDQVLHR